MKKTNKDLTVSFLPSGANEVFTRQIFIPKGTFVSNQTAGGEDANYHFVKETEFNKLIIDGEPFSRKPEMGVYYDLRHHGINVPVDSIEYDKEESKTLSAYFERFKGLPVEFQTTIDGLTAKDVFVYDMHIFGWHCRWKEYSDKVKLFVFC